MFHFFVLSSRVFPVPSMYILPQMLRFVNNKIAKCRNVYKSLTIIPSQQKGNALRSYTETSRNGSDTKRSGFPVPFLPYFQGFAPLRPPLLVGNGSEKILVTTAPLGSERAPTYLSGERTRSRSERSPVYKCGI